MISMESSKGTMDELRVRHFLFVSDWNFYCHNICYKLTNEGSRGFGAMPSPLIASTGLGEPCSNALHMDNTLRSLCATRNLEISWVQVVHYHTSQGSSEILGTCFIMAPEAPCRDVSEDNGQLCLLSFHQWRRQIFLYS